MLLLLPRPGLLCWDELGRESVQLAVCFFDLPVHKADARNERLDMSAGRFNRSPGNLHSRFAQDIQKMGASKRRMRWRFSRLATVPSRMRAALPGVGASSHRSSSHGAPRSLSSSSIAGNSSAALSRFALLGRNNAKAARASGW